MSDGELITKAGMVIAIIAFIFIVQKKNNDKTRSDKDSSDDSQVPDYIDRDCRIAFSSSLSSGSTPEA